MKTIRTRRGYSLLELLIAITLLGTFSLVATRLFRSTFTTMWQSSHANEIPMRFDAAISALRRDVALAASVDISDPRSLIVHDAAGKTVQWRSDGRHEMSRQDSIAAQTWDISQPIEFHREGAIVLVHPKDSADIAMARMGEQ